MSNPILLTDGGVYDNLGVEPVWNRYNTLLVSDAGRPFESVPESGQGILTRLKRSFRNQHGAGVGCASTMARGRFLGGKADRRDLDFEYPSGGFQARGLRRVWRWRPQAASSCPYGSRRLFRGRDGVPGEPRLFPRRRRPPVSREGALPKPYHSVPMAPPGLFRRRQGVGSIGRQRQEEDSEGTCGCT